VQLVAVQPESGSKAKVDVYNIYVGKVSSTACIVLHEQTRLCTMQLVAVQPKSGSRAKVDVFIFVGKVSSTACIFLHCNNT
jgi:glycine/serine hydroxymethyltransferase